MESERPATSVLSLSLPTELRAFAEERASGRYGSVSEYVRDLLRRDQRRSAQERLESLLVEGVESGEPIPVTRESFERKLEELTAEHAGPKSVMD